MCQLVNDVRVETAHDTVRMAGTMVVLVRFEDILLNFKFSGKIRS